jgi:hypothetical protein
MIACLLNQKLSNLMNLIKCKYNDFKTANAGPATNDKTFLL